MRLRAAVVTAVVSMVAAGSSAAAQSVTKGGAVSVTATVEAIDRTDRSVTLKTSDGRSVMTHVAEDVKKFDNLKVGDMVTGTYYVSMVLALEQPGQPPVTFSDETARTPGPTGTAGTVARQVKTFVTIKSIDPAASAMTVESERGRVLDLKVKDSAALAKLMPGDRINVTYTEALLVSVD